MKASTGTCPLCAGQTERVRAEHGGCVSEQFMNRMRHEPSDRRVRPASFWACVACEWCAETEETVGRL